MLLQILLILLNIPLKVLILASIVIHIEHMIFIENRMNLLLDLLCEVPTDLAIALQIYMELALGFRYGFMDICILDMSRAIHGGEVRAICRIGSSIVIF